MTDISHIATDLLDILPNPVLVKDAETRYLWVNDAFEQLFDVRRADLLGQLDVDVFPDRQAAQCNGGDLRVLESGELDEALETVVDPRLGQREVVTRKSRLVAPDGSHVLVGVMHDITDVTIANRQLIKTTHRLEEQSNLLRKMADTDWLTGCRNRRALVNDAPDLLAEYDDTCGVLVLDLDRFKRVNDSYGHRAGDLALQHVAETIRREIRHVDVLARLGGEEFAVLLPGRTVGDVRIVADRLCTAVADNPFEFDGNEVRLTVSIGAVHTTQIKQVTIAQLLDDADRCLYEAKSGGRNRFVLSN